MGEQGPGASKAEDALDRSVSLNIAWHKSGLTIGGQSRALTAADRLLGGVLGWPAAYFEGLRQRAELRNRFREDLIEAESRKALLAVEKGGLAEAAANSFAIQLVRGHLNRERVWAETAKVLDEGSGITACDESEDASSLDDDWLNVFASHAENATSERMQQLWGRILAGEIRRPRSFALSTLRVLSEMDARVAASFQAIVTKRASSEYLVKPEPFTGEQVVEWTFLEGISLLTGVNTFLSNTVEVPPSQAHKFLSTPAYAVLVRAEKAEKLSVRIVMLTRMGQQIASILPWDELGAMTEAANLVGRANPRLDVVLAEVLESGTFRGCLETPAV